MSTGTERRQRTPSPTRSPARGNDATPAAAARPMNAAMMFSVVALTITVVGLLYLVQTAQVASLGYEATRLEQERAAAALENQQLTYEVASLEALPRIERLAVDTLDMQAVRARIFVVVPLPPRDDLSLPEPVTRPEQSLALRVWERLTGQSTATNMGGEP
ncbi:MAG TPA: cell division protein FtsL [Thermomicrobiales bacterium]|nr:cell division protein FtsL [Thermomicrobiales bacterium]